MSKVDEKIAHYKEEMKAHGITLKEGLLEKVTKALGPSIHNNDASKVSTSDPEELARVKKSFLIGKLGLKDGPELDAAMEEAGKKFGPGNKNKHRAIFYALLVEKFNKEDIYK
ncbi:MAG: DUF2853 family protein [Bacteroidetes bacterium]|nr:DUF2853 family protein [Bacteroidota bacterium]